MVDPPYGIIWRRLAAGKVIPFLGAGASFSGRPESACWDPRSPCFLPNGQELANFLAEESSFPSTDPRDRDDLAKVASYYADLSSRKTLRQTIHGALDHDYEPGLVHRLLAGIERPMLIVSTNYDLLLERAFEERSRPYSLVVYPADDKERANSLLWWPPGEKKMRITVPNELSTYELEGSTIIFKMHGTLGRDKERPDNFVVTEEDYVEFLSRMVASAALPAFFFELSEQASFLFLGYSLRDWNLRVVLKNLARHFEYARPAGSSDPGEAVDPEDEEAPHWAIQKSPSELEQVLWRKRGVEIFDATVEGFAARMGEHRGA